MDLLTKNEVENIIKQLGYRNVISWSVTEFSDMLIGYLGEHLTLLIDVLIDDVTTKKLKCFIKCMPRFDEWKSRYIKELTFFQKEYVMLNDLFKRFEQGTDKWRPTCLLIKEDLFVFEDVTVLGYKMPDNRNTLALNEIRACVIKLAKFHSQSYIFEEKRSKEINRTYRIWDEYSEYLRVPERGTSWRNAGRNGVIDFLKAFSKHKHNEIFINNIESIVTKLYDDALALMQPSSKYRNTVIHRDLWTNNIFLKKECDGNIHAMFVDFQTVIYCSPMLDLSSLIYFNTDRDVRENNTDELVDLYYESLSKELSASSINVNEIIDRKTLKECYEESVVYGLTQATLMVPIVSMTATRRHEIFCQPDKLYRVNEVSRSKEFIETALKDDHYRYRVTDLCEEIVDRYILHSKK
ncbi:unnamed protein product [Diatraea saccharalis]|uniref:CHK kinase-like domain-containing protein n=1 Tax=Diatraea saccharalis TaxID=40085 RepID=A0A9P0C6B0_9NEOP|nr:unnamed protein product [Diatraea saccharalis]